MTYNVFGEMLNLALSNCLSFHDVTAFPVNTISMPDTLSLSVTSHFIHTFKNCYLSAAGCSVVICQCRTP